MSIMCPWARHIVTLTFSRPHFPNNTTLSLFTAWWANSFIAAKSFFCVSTKSLYWQRADHSNLCQPAQPRSTFESQICLRDTPTKYFLTFLIPSKTFDNVPNFCQVPLTHTASDRRSGATGWRAFSPSFSEAGGWGWFGSWPSAFLGTPCFRRPISKVVR